jgi:hypothetical protein
MFTPHLVLQLHPVRCHLQATSAYHSDVTSTSRTLILYQLVIPAVDTQSNFCQACTTNSLPTALRPSQAQSLTSQAPSVKSCADGIQVRKQMTFLQDWKFFRRSDVIHIDVFWLEEVVAPLVLPTGLRYSVSVLRKQFIGLLEVMLAVHHAIRICTINHAVSDAPFHLFSIRRRIEGAFASLPMSFT